MNYDAGSFNPATSQAAVVISPALYELNPNTGQATEVASTDFGLATVINLDGTVYGFNGNTDQIDTINVANGATTFVSNIDPAAGLIEQQVRLTAQYYRRISVDWLTAARFLNHTTHLQN